MGLLGLPVDLDLRRERRVARLPLWAAGGIIGAAVAILFRPSLRGELFSIPFPTWAGTQIGLVAADVFVGCLVAAASARRMRAPLGNRRAYPRRAAARRRRRAAAALS